MINRSLQKCEKIYKKCFPINSTRKTFFYLNYSRFFRLGGKEEEIIKWNKKIIFAIFFHPPRYFMETKGKVERSKKVLKNVFDGKKITLKIIVCPWCGFWVRFTGYTKKNQINVKHWISSGWKLLGLWKFL